MAKFTTKNTYKQINMKEVIDFLMENGSAEDKREFKEWLYTNKDGTPAKKENWINAKNKFLAKYNSDLLPKPKPKSEKISNRIKDW